MKRLISASILITSIGLGGILSGCMMIPAVIGAGIGGKTQTIAISGPKFPGDLFREAAIKAGGVVTTSSSDYAKAEFSAAAVKVELQFVKLGEYQLIGSSNAGSSMSMNFINNSIAETTQKIADHIVANDFKLLDKSVN